MAKSFTQQPVEFPTAYNPLVYVATSDQTAQPNHKYIFDIYVDAVKVARVKKIKDSSGRAMIDISPIVRNYVSSDFDNIQDTTKAFVANFNSFVNVRVALGEEYGSPAIIQGAFVDSNFSNPYNASLRHINLVNYDSQDYIVTNFINPASFLTRAPLTQKIRINENAWVYLGQKSFATTTMRLTVTYPSSTEKYEILNFPADDANDSFTRMPAGPVNINRMDSSFFTGLDGTIVTPSNYVKSNALKYTLQYIGSIPFAPVSKTYTFSIIDSPCNYDTRRVHWLNELGGFDSFSFDLKSTKTVDISRGYYQKRQGQYVSGVYSDFSHLPGQVQNKTEVKTKEVIESDWITEVESEWLQDLVTSPEVYIQIANANLGNDYVRVNVVNQSYKVEKKINDKLFRLTLSIEYSLTDSRQNA